MNRLKQNRTRGRREKSESGTVCLRPRRHSFLPFASFAHFAVSLSLLLLPLPAAESADFNPTNATLDELFFHAQRYGNTPERRQRKESARLELLARKAESLKYLMQGVHTENIWYGIYSGQVLDGMATNDVVDALLPFLKSEHKETRRLAVYYLGLNNTPEHAPQILPFLGDEEAAGAAIRTLGKWRVTNAVDRIAGFLSDPKERRRILAVNALGDIRDPRAIPDLLRALSDPTFTVRRAAARALRTFGPAAEGHLLAALKESVAPARREIVQILGDIRSRNAVALLRATLDDPDRNVRATAATALNAIVPNEASDWIKGTKADGVLTSTGLLTNEP